MQTKTNKPLTMMEKWGNPQQKQFGITQFLIWFTFSATALGVAILTALQPVWANLPLNVVCGVLVLVFCKPVKFEMMKLSTLLILRTLVAVVVLGVFSFLTKDVYVVIVKLFLIINILEATFTDFKKNNQILNGISGIALAAGVFALSGSWDAANPMYVLEGKTLWISITYIAAYTLWNWIFVTGEFSTSVSIMHFGFLGAPIIGCFLFGPGYWVLFRANSLTFGGIMQIAGKQYWEESLHNEKIAKFIDFTHKKSMQVLFMILNVGSMAAILLATYVF